MQQRLLALLATLAAFTLTACGAFGGLPAIAEAPTATIGTPAAPAADAGGATLRLTIGAGGTGGVFFPYGGGLAKILTEKMPNTEATALETGGSVDNMKLIQTGEVQIGMSTVDSALDAVNGSGAYSETGKVPAAALAVLYPSFVHVVASEESGITSVADFKGRPIAVGSAGSSTEAVADRLMEAAGLDPQVDITRENLSIADSVAAMKDKKIDAFVWIGGLPTSAVTDLVATEQVRFLDTSALLQPMVDKYGPIYTAMTLPQAVYGGVEADVPGIGVGNILFVRDDMPADQVTAVLETIFDNLAEVQQIHPAAQDLTLETAWTGSSIPFHPAAEAFYKERGVWK